MIYDSKAGGRIEWVDGVEKDDASTMISRFVTGTTDVQRGMLTIITRRQSRITLRESSCIRVDLTLAVRREQTDGINGWEVEQINFLEINNSVKLSLRDTYNSSLGD